MPDDVEPVPVVDPLVEDAAEHQPLLRRTALIVLVVVAALVVAAGVARMAWTWAAAPESAAATDTPSAAPPMTPSTEPSTDPSVAPPRDAPATLTFYAHPPISFRGTSPAQYVRALADRSAWADGLFLYYPASLRFGARPEIDALQEAYPDGVPLTVSAKNADPAGVAAFRDQLTPQQARVTVWERWQEPADDFTTSEERARFRADVLADIELLRPAGIRVGVHEQCWTLDPANRQSWSGAQALRELIPPEVDIVTATCLGDAEDDDGPVKMARWLDFMKTNYPDVETGFTSLSWSVPEGTPPDSPLRAARAEVVRESIEYAIRQGVTEFGWFDFADWEGQDTDAASDPALLGVLTELSSQRSPQR